jgi:hypothetical protein
VRIFAASSCARLQVRLRLHHHVLGRGLDEVRVVEPALQPADLLGQLVQRLLQAGLFLGDVDQPFQRDREGRAFRRDGDAALGRRAFGDLRRSAPAA